jgi:hypothetical protein
LDELSPNDGDSYDRLEFSFLVEGVLVTAFHSVTKGYNDTSDYFKLELALLFYLFFEVSPPFVINYFYSILIFY